MKIHFVNHGFDSRRGHQNVTKTNLMFVKRFGLPEIIKNRVSINIKILLKLYFCNYLFFSYSVFYYCIIYGSKSIVVVKKLQR